ncbi:hypothetical protein M758_4G141400 [Ceratodon purpureus]|nr:hypothetical protein M758_4G141400 [Ceratodon purpureus]
MANPLGSTPGSVPLTPTIQVPQPTVANDGLLSRRDMVLLFARDTPLARATPQAQKAAQLWAQKTNSVVKTVASEATQAITQFDNFLYTLLPHAQDDIVLKGSVIIQKKILALDMGDLVADTGDDLAEVMGQHVTIQLVSTKLADSVTKRVAVSDEVPVLPWVATGDMLSPTNFRFSLDFKVSKDFGTPGAIIVKNRHVSEFLLVSFAVQMPDSRVINFPAGSWVYNTNFKGGRIFFSNDLYLPSATPDGLVFLRDQELQNLRGNGLGERSYQDRIYDYATYNDLGDADQDETLTRPVLGGSPDLPYPRRVRTGRVASTKDPKSESRGNVLTIFYIPRDERFDQVKFSDFAADAVRGGSHKLIPTLKTAAGYGNQEFISFEDIKTLYVATDSSVTGALGNLKPQGAVGDQLDNLSNQNPLTFVHEYAFPSGSDTDHITYPLPAVITADDKAWCSDIEFARQMLAGLNPLVIQLLKEFPIKSKLDPIQFGDPLSAITSTHIGKSLEGLTIDQALANKRLFVQDYHDIFLPYINRINAQNLGCMYAPRTLLFLTSDNILTPLAIELTLPPPAAGGVKKSRVFTPTPPGSPKNWLWELAKAHVSSCDSSYHEVISHYLRTHACIEPFIIATNRQLSVLHPVHRVLVPHYKNTLDINGAARKALVNAGGIIEYYFTPGKYTMEMSSVVYKLDWRFDEQALPEDLIKRGMAVRDPTSKSGVKLVIADYPYAADGLEIWTALKEYMTDHVKIFYASDKMVQDDKELQTWWTEVRTVGHGDKKDSPGWPTLNSVESLAYTLTTIAWVASCHHAAVNFGQYAYGGYMPNKPSLTRKLIPEPGTADWDQLQKNPERFYLDSISNQSQATSVMATIEILSTHALDEEYLGQRLTPNWSNDPNVLAAFAKFSGKVNDIEDLIHSRNADKSLKNRSGLVQLPYELLLPTSTPGLTGKGVPNSVSI